ncbi:hypothetical protein [Rhizorhabdus histidinilytica]
MSTDQKLYRCWRGGLGIGQTILAVRRTTGERLAFEQVRLAFVSLAERFG